MSYFDEPRMLDALCYDLLLSEWPRGANRALIQNLANGEPPYTDQEVEDNAINVNISDLSHTRLCHDARSQFYNAFLKNGFFARARLDGGAAHLRSERSATASEQWNRVMKRSIAYYERLRSEFGMLVLSGISPGVWRREDEWCPRALAVEDVLLPGETLLGFENLPLMVFRRSFTGIELKKLTYRETRDVGWNMPFVERIIEWMEQQATQLRAMNWPDVWSPEKIAERIKSQAGGTLAGDQAPRINVFDIYLYDDSENSEGWVRRMIMDSWSEPNVSGGNVRFSRKNGVNGDTNNFIFTSGKRKVARSWQNIASFQFADLSAVFPPRYHSVRGLGWMLYSACHVSNRMRCKFYESIFEALNMLFEVDSQDDAQNALKLNMVNRGFIDKSIRPVKAQDRWQVNAPLVQLGLQDNARVITENSRSMTPSTDYSRDSVEKTRYQVMAELNAMTSLVGAALQQAYMYQRFEFIEIFRRFCNPESNDRDVRAYRAACLAKGIPEKYLRNPEAWDIESEQVLGGGNKTLAMTIAQQLMEWREKFDPEPQRRILRDAVLAITDDPSYAKMVVPEQKVKVTPATHDAELTASAIMQGIPVQPVEGVNHIETIQTLIGVLAYKVNNALQQGGMVDPTTLQGLNGIAQHITAHIEFIAANAEEKQRVKEFSEILSGLTNHLRAFGQRLEQAMKKQQEQQAQGNGQGMDPKDMAKIQAIIMQAQAKVKISQESHAARTAQRAVTFQEKLKQEQMRNQVEMQKLAQKQQADLAAKDLQTASEIRHNRLRSLEP